MNYEQITRLKINKKHTQTITQTIMIITRMIRFFLMQFMNIADGDLPTKFVSALKLSLIASPFILIWDKIVKWGIPNQVSTYVETSGYTFNQF